jgi:hypothetical protein
VAICTAGGTDRAQYITRLSSAGHPLLKDPFLFLSGALGNAHHAIRDYAADRFLPEAPRTTCVACVVQDSIAYWAHAGDSRLYAIRGGRILAQTRDHSRVQRMIEDGLITAEAAIHHPARNRIFSCLGGASAPQIDYSKKTPLMTGDIIVLCTDGVWGPLPSDVIPRAMGSGNVVRRHPPCRTRPRPAAATTPNLSMITIRWEDNYAEDTLGSVSTKTMPIDSFTTKMEAFAKARKGAQPMPNLSDGTSSGPSRKSTRSYGNFPSEG